MQIADLSPSGWLQAIHWFDELPSTQYTARQLALQAEQFPLLVGTDQQTAGRGRGSHRWWSGQGSLTVSLVIDPSAWGAEQQIPAHLALAVGVSLLHTVNRYLPSDRTAGLHWPNDIYVGNRKLAGILTEVVNARRIIIGVGVNTNNSLESVPEELQSKVATMLDFIGKRVSHQEFLSHWLTELHAALDLLFGGSPVLGQEYQRHCLQLGQYLTLYHGSEEIFGICRGIASDGGLMLETERGLQRFYAGSLAPH